MGIILEVEESGFTGFIEDGEIYNARIVSIELKEKPFKDERTGEPVKKFEFKFKISSDDEHDTQFIWGEAGTRITDHPENRLRNWAEAILGTRLPVHYKFNTDDLVDRDCRIIVGKKVTNSAQGEKTRNWVREVHPTKEAAARLAASVPDEPF